jgi:translation initiation factor IF-1
VVLADPSLGVLTETGYMVRYANGKFAQGRTDGRGRLRVRTDWGDFVDVAIQSRVKTRSRRVMLTKEPASTPRGAWARLVNLGYVEETEPPVDPSEEALSQALRRFQVDHGLKRTGTLDPICGRMLAREGDQA